MEENKEITPTTEEQKTEPYYDSEKKKWIGYKAEKGKTPPWKPFDQPRKPRRMTIRERKFLLVLSTTGSLTGAYRAAYKVKSFPDKKMENARVYTMANQVIRRLRIKYPEWVKELTFEDISPDFVRKELMSLYKEDGATVTEKTQLLKLMGQIHGMFTEKNVVETKIREVADSLYAETEEEFPTTKDFRLSRLEIDDKIPTA